MIPTSSIVWRASDRFTVAQLLKSRSMRCGQFWIVRNRHVAVVFVDNALVQLLFFVAARTELPNTMGTKRCAGYIDMLNSLGVLCGLQCGLFHGYHSLADDLLMMSYHAYGTFSSSSFSALSAGPPTSTTRVTGLVPTIARVSPMLISVQEQPQAQRLKTRDSRSK